MHIDAYRPYRCVNYAYRCIMYLAPFHGLPRLHICWGVIPTEPLPICFDGKLSSLAGAVKPIDFGESQHRFRKRACWFHWMSSETSKHVFVWCCLLYLWISVCFSHPGMMIPPLNIHQVPNIAASMGPPAALGPSAPLGISGDFCWRHRGFLGHQLGGLRRLIWFDHWS